MNSKFDELAKNLAQSVTRCGGLKRFGLGLGAAALCAAGTLNAQTAFTYQGKLTDGGNPATGLYDLVFKVYDTPDANTPPNAQVGATFSTNRVPVANGLFTVRLDFDAPGSTVSAVFTGARRWLQIEARTNTSPAGFVLLLPRTELTASPYALFATSVGSVAASALAPSPGANQILSYNGSSLQWTPTPTGTFGLPYSATLSSPGSLFTLNNSGAGPAATFRGTSDQIHIQGAATGAGNSAYMSFADGAGTLTGFVGDAASGDSDVFLGAYGGNAVLYASPAGRVLTATPSGNVGIGTTDPFRRLTVQAAYDGDGIEVVGSRPGVRDAGYRLSDDAGNRAALGLASFANAWMTGAQPGDLCLGANQGNLRIGVVTGLEFPVMSVGRKAVVVSPSYPDAGNVTLTAASVDGTAFYCHSYGLPFHAHNDFTGTDAILGGGAAAVFTGGNVGVGTAIPQALLHVYAPDYPTVRIQSHSAAGFSPGRLEFWSDAQGSAGEWRPGFIQSEDRGNFTGELAFYVNTPGNTGGAVETLRLSGDGAKVKVLTITGGADLAEPFRMSSKDIPKGALVVIDEENSGQLKLSERPYDTRVAGIVSGANGIKAGIQLHQEGVLEGGQNVALSGRVYALADASEARIKPGDPLTTSATPGHCMKVTDHARAQGAIIGKAMSALNEGKGMVLVLVSLQ